MIPAMNVERVSNCVWCVEAKNTKKPFKSVTTRKIELLKRFHSDLAEFKNTISKRGKRYYMTLVDNYFR